MTNKANVESASQWRGGRVANGFTHLSPRRRRMPLQVALAQLIGNYLRRECPTKYLKSGPKFPFENISAAVAFGVALFLSNNSFAYWVSDCVQYGGTRACIPTDNPAPVAGVFDIDTKTNCNLFTGEDGERINDGRLTSMLQFAAAGDPLPWPYVSITSYCPNFPHEYGYTPRLLDYSSNCRDGYQSTSDLVPDSHAVLCVPGPTIYHDKPPSCPGKKASLFGVGDPIYPLIGSSSYDV
ncbi:hypothetical protein, partial [Ideonella azotifigens]|uniref:hypothetical protein n=1 Tax=Ideonella azotifigens TaxID=513160 RepID=UPI0031D73C3C